MRPRQIAVLVAVLILTAVTGVLVARGGPVTGAAEVTVTEHTTVPGVAGPARPSGRATSSGTGPSKTASAGAAGSASSQGSPVPAAGATAGGQGTASAGARPASNVPMRKLRPGEKPPQFVIFSFDGAGSHTKWQEFLATAETVDARFTGFLTGLYLLADDNRERYTGPGHAPGKSSVGFGGTPQEVATLVGDLNTAYATGHEIGTHYNGHFCSGAEPSADAWSTADWNSELDQFFGFLTRYRQNNPGVALPTLTVPTSSIKGGRTQCLEGTWDQLVPAWKRHGLTYDSSVNAPAAGVSWPVRTDGIWEFAMPYVYSPGFGGMVVNMDYNMWVKFNGGRTQPGTEKQLRDKVYRTYTYLYEQTFAGNRAPLLVANHFNNWNGNAFNPAVRSFMQDYCGRPETVCATYQDVIAWMELQDPAVLERLQDQAPVAGSAP
ncbi:polysaccharide deacetylase [Nakamurella endophytica]|uniref:Polysaccharide deacetylase n=1 Tax=Nakamurella endophytica TaxID=1748367 RepID=A0A917SLV5_9ACTN|nr:polysaccharide deacetylase [Nakamurella endophytica]GGL88565.1 hypothetical protein GCM10011594_05210 [Nakamurella endophytica]